MHSDKVVKSLRNYRDDFKKAYEKARQAPQTLDELIAHCNEWDGKVTKVVPYYHAFETEPEAPLRLKSVSIWVDPPPKDPIGGEYEQCWRYTSAGWVLSGDGTG